MPPMYYGLSKPVTVVSALSAALQTIRLFAVESAAVLILSYGVGVNLLAPFWKRIRCNGSGGVCAYIVRLSSL